MGLATARKSVTFLQENSHEKFQSRLNAAQIVICAGVCCAVFACVSNFVGIVYAQCANMTVRANSPCKTTLKVCVMSAGLCPGKGETTAAGNLGNFQCDQPKSGTTCIGTGEFAPCYVEADCTPDGSGGCMMKASTAQSYTAETKKETQCAG